MEQKWQVGLTGGIGAGKSTVALIFEALEIPIYYADNQARRLMREDSTLKREILDLLGPESFHEDGRLHRQFISQKVFGDHALLARLNGLVHPVVHQDATTWHQEQYKVPYTIREAALLFESGSYLAIDIIINVSAPESLRIDRVKKRDGVDRKAVVNRIKNQWPESRRLQLADFTIVNDGSTPLILQILPIHAALRNGTIHM